MPRVLYVLNAFNRGGAELGLVQLVRGGAFDGCDLQVIGLARGSGEPLADLERLGTNVSVLSNSARLRILDWLLSVPRLALRIRSARPHVMVLSLPQANIAGRIASIGHPVLVASFEHNTHLSRRIFERLFRLTSPLVDWLIADSEATAIETQERLYRSRPRETFVMPLVAFDDPAGQSAKPAPSRFTVINAGRFSPVKNQAALIRALRLVRAKGLDAHLILYGEGECRETCEALVAELGLADAVTFPGFYPNWPETPASAFALASAHEGLCIVALEAMHAGLPVIAPRVGAIADYGVEGGVNFIEDCEPATIAAAIEALMTSRAQQERSVRDGTNLIRRRFSRNASLESYERFRDRLTSATR